MPASALLDLSFRDTKAAIANIYAADAAVQEAVVRLNREAGEYARELTQFFSPVDTGFMRDHVRVIFGPKGYSFEVGWLEEDFINAGLAFYPIFQEYGTRNMPAQPSLTPAYREVESWYIPAMSEEIRAAIERLRAA